MIFVSTKTYLKGPLLIDFQLDMLRIAILYIKDYAFLYFREVDDRKFKLTNVVQPGIELETFLSHF